MFFVRNSFSVHFCVYGDRVQETPKLKWDGAKILLERIETQQVGDSCHVTVVLRPVEEGTYHMSVVGRGDDLYFYDTIHVLRGGFTYSSATGDFTGDSGLLAAIMLFFTGMGVLLLSYFAYLKGSRIYSYDAIASFGGGVFCALTGLMMLYMCYNRLLSPDLYTMSRVFLTIASAGQSFLLFTSPLGFLFAVLLIVSNVALLRHECFRRQNVLGLGLGLLMIAGELFSWLFLLRYFSGSTHQFQIFNTLNSIFATVLAYFECILLGSVVCGFRAARHVPDFGQDYILILGCGFRKDGTLPPLLRGRVDKAVEFWRNQKEATGKEAILIPSGGQGPDEMMSESEAMTRYLHSLEIPESAILMEDQSANTFQNMQFSAQKIRERESGKSSRKEKVSTMFVTTNYHVFRSGVWANLAGLPSEGLGSRTKWWFWPNAFIRECVGLLANRIRTELIGLVLLVIIFSLLSYLSAGLV